MSTRKDLDPDKVFARWLARLDAGEEPSFDELLAEHPRHAAELRRLHEYWSNLGGVLGHMLSPSSEASPAPGQERRAADPYRGPASLGRHSDLVQPGSRLGRFELEAEIGLGGMGVVWRARDLVLNESVALKFLPQVLVSDKMAMLRLRREAKVLLSLSHPNIVRLHTIEGRQGLTFLVEEYLRGPTLGDLVEGRLRRGERSMTPDELLWVLEQLVSALGYAHGEGVTHRDIKPSNMMLDTTVGGPLGSGPERLKLTDFGLAFVATSALSQISSYRPSGTLPYMAPEVLMGQKPTPSADIYGLGVTLYALMKGEPPFTHGDIATQILARVPDALASGNERLDAAVAAAMAKKPEDRPATVAAMLEIARGERKAPRRRRRVRKVLLGGVVAAGLAAGAWFGWSALEPARAPVVAATTRSEGAAEAERDPFVTPVIGLEEPFDEVDRTIVVGPQTRALFLRGRITNARGTDYRVIVDGRISTGKIEADASIQMRIQDQFDPGIESLIRVEAEGAQALEFHVYPDHEAPEITWRSPAGLVPDAAGRLHWKTSAPVFDLCVEVTDPTLTAVRLDGRELVRREDTLYVSPGIALAPGTNSLKLRAEDRGANVNEQELVVEKLSGGPQLVEITPGAGTVLHWREPVSVRLVFQHAVLSADFAGVPLAIEPDGIAATGTLLVTAPPDGAWKARWTARDRIEESVGDLTYPIEVVARAPELGGRQLTVLDPTPGWNRWARRVKDPKTELVFRLVDPGAFRMGARPGTGRIDEEPWREVRLSRPYYLAEREVTLGAFEAFVKESAKRTLVEVRNTGFARTMEPTCAGEPSREGTWSVPIPGVPAPEPEHPVTQVSWFDARAFCAQYGYRLPTEAEWEYACRAGPESIYSWGDAPGGGNGRGNFADGSTLARFSKLPSVAAFPFQDGFAFTAPVASFAPNAWGFHDMLGNVSEWCEDLYDPVAHRGIGCDALEPEHTLALVTDPVNTSSDGERPRVVRGGSWLSGPDDLGCARRAFDFPDRGSDTRGFRPAFWPESNPTAVAVSPPTAPRADGPVLKDSQALVPFECELETDIRGDARLSGELVARHPNGVPAEAVPMKNGLRNGPWKLFTSEKQPKASGYYKDDRRVRRWNFWWPSVNEAHGDSMRAKGEFVNGEMDGQWEFWTETGAPDAARSGEYGHREEPHAAGPTLNGKRHGWWTLSWPDGAKRFEGPFASDKRHGDWRFWHPEGTYDPQMLSGHYEHGRRTSAGVLWRPATEDYAASGLTLSNLAALEPALGRLDEETNARVRELRKAGVEAIAGLREKPMAWQRFVPALIAELLRLDPSSTADAVYGQKLQRFALQPLSGGRMYRWAPATTPSAREENYVQTLRLLSLWLLTGKHDLFWELDVRAPLRADPALESSALDVSSARVFESSLFFAPPLYEEWAASAPRRDVRAKLKWGGSALVQDIDDALAWLAAHQAHDGSWDSDAFSANCGKLGSTTCAGPGDPHHDVGVTGLALLAFLGAGQEAPDQAYRGVVLPALEWLMLKQDRETGCFGDFSAPPTGTMGFSPNQLPIQPQRGDDPGEPNPPLEVQCPTCFGRGFTVKGVACTACGGDGRKLKSENYDLRSGLGSTPSAKASSGTSSVYDHAIATLAVCRAYESLPSAALEEAAQLGVNWILAGRNPYGAWRYDMPPVGDNDLSVTAWMVQALATARGAGLSVDGIAFEGALSLIDEISDPASGRVGYSAFGELSSRTLANQHYPREKGEAMTAAGLLSRFLVGETPERSPIMAKHAELIRSKPPVWDPEGFGSDFYYWYFGTNALWQMGKPYWPIWERAMKTAVVDSQRKDGDEKGSWDPEVCAWGFMGGRVYSTALLALCLEVYASEVIRR